ncbi:unnamed protein product [Parascedosporium putredinis]|uniref:CTP synthase n=1 Tax=Parascedosporium putredinis TaxID=1442378 RepID=A0A9P1H2H4_9PEZI|nr:unnamed protein product [Parascedosporium putredinis]CAI7993686.1 unnamed protein product [Parascedosporium putredinis]
MKYILVTGGVISGVGKGIIASSTGLLLKSLGLKVTAIKIDPYINLDAGTMKPTEHGECFVLADGGEVDLDMGNYERYLAGISLTREHNITTGQVYKEVIDRERRGDYLGKTVQIVPHVTNAIRERIERVARIPVDASGEEPDVCIVELGGTVGDIESMPFVEAITQLRYRTPKDDFFSIHVSFVPEIHGEQKTKPTQHSVKTVRSAGIIPDLLACRCNKPLEASTVSKIALHCQVEERQVLVVYDMPSIYQVPILLDAQDLVSVLNPALNLNKIPSTPHARDDPPVTIVLVGKYTELHDSYLSVLKSLEHSAMKVRRTLDLQWIDSELLEEGADKEAYETAWKKVRSANGVLVPGGFGHRGTEGMMAAAKYARENKIPYLGICLGMQVAVIEFARNVANLNGATSEEFDGNAEHQVVIFMPEIDKTKMGGTMRLGLHDTHFQPGSEWSRLRQVYGNAEVVSERHRHRYEGDRGERMEIMEIKEHPYYVGVQYHPEYTSRVLDASKPYLGFVAASAGCLEGIMKEMAQRGTNGAA